MFSGYGYMRNNLIHLGGYLTHRDVVDLSNLFIFILRFYDQEG